MVRTLVMAGVTSLMTGLGPVLGTDGSLAGSALPQADTSPPDPIVIEGAVVIDGIADEPLGPRTVVVANGVIVEIGRPGEVEIPAGATVLDGAGRFLIPGLWDTHAHLSYWGEDALELLVRSGVTSIRELGGDPDEIAGWIEATRTGTLLGPAIAWCGPFLEGADGGEEYRMTVATPEAARAAARTLARREIDFLKIQPRIERDVVRALIEEGRELGLSVVGHLPTGVSAIEGSEMGLRSIEHLSPYLRLDESQLTEVFDVFRRNGTWMSPALFSMVAPIEAAGGAPADQPRIQRAYEVVRKAHEAGVPLLVGSNFAYREWPQTPGSSLHGEMRTFVQAGLSPMDVLKLSTSRAAEFMGASRRTGSIRVGLAADLVLLAADPLEQIDNTTRIVAVVLGGQIVQP